MAEPTWRERGEKLFESARRGASPDLAVVDGLLAIYCELRHAADESRTEPPPRDDRDGSNPEP